MVLQYCSASLQNILPCTYMHVSQALYRKSTALPGLMFERPTRHPSLDDIRGYGRRRRGGLDQRRGNGGLDQPPAANLSGESADRIESLLHLPPISRTQREAAVDFTKCLHPQSRICENLKYNLHQVKIRAQAELRQALVDSVVFGPAEVTTSSCCTPVYLNDFKLVHVCTGGARGCRGGVGNSPGRVSPQSLSPQQ